MLSACHTFPGPLLPVVDVSPPRPLGILRVVVTDHCPIHGVDDGVPIAIQIGAHLKSAHRAPLATLVSALAVEAPQIIRSLGLDKDEVAMRRFHSPPPSVTPILADRGCGTESPRSRASARGPPSPRGRPACGQS